jgi:predicted transcriptional regulator
MKVLSIRLNERETARLEMLCERTGMTPSKAVKRGLDELASKQQGKRSLGQLARAMDLVGCFSARP